MTFEVNSAYFRELDINDPYGSLDYINCIKEYLDILEPYIFIKNDQVFIEIESIQKLSEIVDTLNKNFEHIENDNFCWAPTEVIIDFKNKILTFKDYYTE